MLNNYFPINEKNAPGFYSAPFAPLMLGEIDYQQVLELGRNVRKRQKTYLRTCVPNVDSIRIFTGRILDMQGCEEITCGQQNSDKPAQMHRVK